MIHAILLSVLCFVCTFNSQRTFAQTTLSQGDLSIVGFNSNPWVITNVNNGFAFVCWVDISNNTVIKFTTNGFNSISSSTTSGNANTSSNNTIYWTNNTGSTIAKGIVITIGGTSSNAMLANYGSITYGTSGSGGNGSSFQLSNSGRALFVYQGSDFSASSSATATFSGTLLYGLTYNGSLGTDAWLTSGSSSIYQSYQPADLSNSYQLSNLGTSVRCASYTGATSGFANVSALKAAVNNVSNWTVTTSTTGSVTFPGNFTVPVPNTAPAFTSGTTTLTLCQNASATSVNSLLTVSDADASQTETWSVTSSPSHGTLSGFNATASSGSTSITPSGLAYTPASGYSGSDAFTVQVSDGTATASVTINVTVNGLPTITLGSNPSICNGTTSANLTYSATTNSPNQYSLAWNASGIIAGFSNVSLTTLPASPITITAPSNPGAGSYTGTLTVKNTTTGCSSTGASMSVTVNALPTITLGSNPSICNGVTSANLTYSATTNSPNQYSLSWGVAGIIAGFSNVSLTTLPASPITITAPSNPGAGTYTVFLTVKNTTTGCSSASTSKSLTVSSLPTITLGSNPSICNGITSANLTYSATTNSPNQYSIAWNASAIIAGFSNVSLTTLPASPISLTTPSNPGAGSYTGTLTVKNTTTGCSSTGSGMGVTVNATNIISSASNQTHDAAGSSGMYTDGSCNIISTVQPSGVNPVTGNVTSKIWIESSVPVYGGQPYVARHYEITPATNAGTATGTVTLYYLQSEFDAFNAAPGSTLNLPTGSSDAAGIANLRIGKYSGTSSDNSGLPGTYSNGAIIIDPTDANIVWNASASRWEVTFNVSGFSGFIVQTSTSILPVTWISFTAEKFNEKVLLKWKTAQETNSSHFVIEHSADGRHFAPVGSVAASGTSNYPVSYGFVHDAPQKENNYYRMLQVDQDGNKEYSVVRMINFTTISNGITILVNPVRDGQLQVQFDKAANTIIYDARGRIMMRQKIVPGSQVINVSNLSRGIYLLQAGSQAKKFIIE